MNAIPGQTSYDKVPYDSFPFAQTHPDRLAVLATLLGLRPVPVTRCRVLELGCAAGGNLIPVAASFPESSFVGIDLSRVQIEQGQKLVQQLGLRNIELKQLSILDVLPELGKFDYIMCHGVFSWVPTAVQDRILEICKQNLSANGVACVSYNTYPGWHMRGMIRDMLSYHARQFREPAMCVKQARNLLDFLAKSVAAENSPYSLMLKGELEAFRRSSDAYLYHEHLEEVNDPIYFYQFAERAAAKGLRYLAETDLRVMVPGNYPPEVENVLQMLAQDLIHLEQYMDCLRNWMFRQTLLCHDQVTPNYQLRGEQLRAFHVASPVREAEKPKGVAIQGMPAAPLQPTPKPSAADRVFSENAIPPAFVTAATAGPPVPASEEGGKIAYFESPDGIKLASRDPLVQAAMKQLSAVWPRALRFDEVVDAARQQAAGAKKPNAATLQTDRQNLGQAFLSFYASASTSLIELHLNPPRLVNSAGEKPLASPLARAQGISQNRVTSLRHDSVTLGEFDRHLLRHLDGSNDRSGLREAMSKLVSAGELTVEKEGEPVRDMERLGEVLKEAIENQLGNFARSGLLAG